MKQNHKNLLLGALCAALAVTMLLGIAGCGSKAEPTEAATTAAAVASGSVIGQGQTVFTLEVTDAEGQQTSFEIHTDKETVGDALLETGLVAGEDGDYGLYITTVNGVTLDWDKDGKYWAFYIDGEYATTGVDATEVTPGAVYSLRAEG